MFSCHLSFFLSTSGHYYAFVRPNIAEAPHQWFKIDDDRVYPVSQADAVDANFGGPDHLYPWSDRFNSAYMLTYVRRSKLDTVLPKVLHV